MSEAELRGWFVGLRDSQQQAWLDDLKNAVVAADLIDTLPPERRLGRSGAWVKLHSQADWTSERDTTSTYLEMTRELREFLQAEDRRRRGS